MTTRDEQLEHALKALSVNELEGVLDALTLVAEYWEPSVPTRGLYLKPPHGELIATGAQKCIVKPREYDILGDWVLVSGKLAYGTMSIGEPSLVDTKEFDDRRNEHCITRSNRLHWWPERDSLFLYPVIDFKAYDSPRDVHVRPGVQTVIDKVTFADKQSGDRSQSEQLPVPEPSTRTESCNTMHDYHALTVRVLDTEQDSEKGFSGRESIEENEGILIPLSPNTGIWMRNTYVPLSVAFLSADYKVLSLVSLTPEDETVHIGPDGTTWALEAVPTWFKNVELEVGDQLIGLPAREQSIGSPIVIATAENEVLYGVELEQ